MNCQDNKVSLFIVLDDFHVITNPETYLGSIRATINIDKLDDFLSHFDLKEPSHAWLEDSTHRILTHPGGMFYGRQHESVHAEYPRLIVHQPFSILGTEFFLGISQPLEMITVPLSQHLRNTSKYQLAEPNGSKSLAIVLDLLHPTVVQTCTFD